MKETGKKAELRDRLKEALADNDMRPIDLATKADIPKSMISYYLAGKSKPKADRLYKMSQALSVSEAWLMGYDVAKTRTAEQKKNDTIVSVVTKLRADADFFNVVSQLAELPAEEYASIKLLISSLRNK